MVFIAGVTVSVAIAVVPPLSLHLINVDRTDDTFVYTGDNKTLSKSNLVWLTTLSTFWYKSIEVDIKSSDALVNDHHTARVYAVPVKEYRTTEVINETCGGGPFLPPRLDLGMQVRYLYAHLPFSHHGCVTNPSDNVNNITVQAVIFRLSSKKEFDRYLQYLVDGHTTFALNMTSVATVRHGKTKCVHLEVDVPHSTFYYVTMVVSNESVISHPVNYSCYSLKQYRDFDRKLHRPICDLDSSRPCNYNLYNGSFINTNGRDLAIAAEVSRGSSMDEPTTTLTVHSSKDSNVVNLGVIIGVVVAVVVMVIILVLLLIACVRMYLSSDHD